MKNKIAISIILSALVVIPASAATTTTKLTKIISRSDTAINARITALNNLATRTQGLKNVSDAEKSTIASEIQAALGDMTSIKSKIDADTDVVTATADEKTITQSYRIYALIVPQATITAAADRITTLVAMLGAISGKLQTRITTEQSAGKDVTALQAAVNDLNVKVVDANTQAMSAQNNIVSLTPDNGDQTKLKANTAALKAARANLKTATLDLQAARKDADTVVKGLPLVK